MISDFYLILFKYYVHKQGTQMQLSVSKFLINSPPHQCHKVHGLIVLIYVISVFLTKP